MSTASSDAGGSEQRPFAVDGTVSEDKLLELLAVQAEHAELDYKSYLDPTKQDDKVEFAKDVAAMQSLPQGGYLVIGADQRGQPTTEHGVIREADFDETKLRQAVDKFLPQPSGLTVAVHRLDGIDLALIYVAPRAEGFTVVQKHGQLLDNTTVLRKGDVFVRHGTSSERWDQNDVQRILSYNARRARQAARAELAADSQQGLESARLAKAPLGAITWKLDEEHFSQALAEAARARDMAAVRAAMLPMAGDAELFYAAGDYEGLHALLDRVVAVPAIGLTFGFQDLLQEGIRLLERIYHLARASAPPHGQVGAARLWWSVVTRVEALGGLAVRLEDWETVKHLAGRPYSEDGGYTYSSWLRHGFVAASRATIIPTVADKPSGGALVAFAREHAGTVSALHPDFNDATANDGGATTSTHDRLLDSIVQFDLLWCVIAVALGAENDHYPGFSMYDSSRSRPVLDLLASDLALREELLPGKTEDEWRSALKSVFERAFNQSAQYDRWWTNPSAKMSRFLGED